MRSIVHGELKALIFQYAIWAAGDHKDNLADPELRISGIAMQNAIRLTEWFQDETRRIYPLLAESEKDAEHRKLTAMISRNGGRITVRELQKNSNRYKRSAAVAEAALNELCKAGYTRWQPVPTTSKGGHPTKECVLIGK